MLRVLIVDDNFANRQFLFELLGDRATCHAAVNGKEAVEAFKASVENDKPYDLILLDIAMPEMNGIEFLHAVRSDEERRGVILGEGVPIIMVTAHEEPFMKAFNLGCDDYVLKPIDPEELFRKIDELVARKKG